MFKRAIKSILGNAPFVNKYYLQLRAAGAYPPGHYHSPIPSIEEVTKYIAEHPEKDESASDVDFNLESQFRALQDYQSFYSDLPFPEHEVDGLRYYYEQPWFSYSDAIFLYCFLRRHQPGRIVEIGSGFSSAVMLDAVDQQVLNPSNITFIEPNPNRLYALLRESDRERVKIIETNVQDVPIAVFKALEPGDFLFVDSSHVIKCGSDLQRIMFEILPILPVGVFVHFHDVFYPFEYPLEWYKAGMFWNEIYILRAFLAYNSNWEIVFFNHQVGQVFQGFLASNMPMCTKNLGGGIYLKRIK